MDKLLVTLASDYFIDEVARRILVDYLLDYPHLIDTMYDHNMPWYIRAAVVTAANKIERQKITGFYSEALSIWVNPEGECLPFCISNFPNGSANESVPMADSIGIIHLSNTSIVQSVRNYPEGCSFGGDKNRPVHRRRLLVIDWNGDQFFAVPQNHLIPLPMPTHHWPEHIQPLRRNLILFSDQTSALQYLAE